MSFWKLQKEGFQPIEISMGYHPTKGKCVISDFTHLNSPIFIAFHVSNIIQYIISSRFGNWRIQCRDLHP